MGPWGICRPASSQPADKRSSCVSLRSWAPRATGLTTAPFLRFCCPDQNWGPGDPRAATPGQAPRQGGSTAEGGVDRSEIRRRPHAPSVSRGHLQKGLTQHPCRALRQSARWRPLEDFEPAPANRAVRVHVTVMALQVPVRQLVPQRGTMAQPHPSEG